MNKKIIRKTKFLILVLIFVILTLSLLFMSLKDYGISDVLSSKRFWITCIMLTVIIGLIPDVFGYGKSGADSHRCSNKGGVVQTDFKKISGISERNLSNALENGGMVIGTTFAGKNGKEDIKVTLADSNVTLMYCDDNEKRVEFLDDNIAFFAAGKTKPNLYIKTDSEETFLKHKPALEKNGYRAYLFNLKEPFKSDRWNPFDEIIKDADGIREIREKLESRDGKYYVAENSFNTYKDVREKIDKLKSDMYEKAKSFADTILGDKIGEDGRILAVAFILAFCEDYVDGKIRKEQINLYDLKRNIVRNAKEPISVKRYLCDSRESESVVRTVFLGTDVNVLPETLLSSARLFNSAVDDGVKNLTAETDVDFNDGNSPIAFFVVGTDTKNCLPAIERLIWQGVTNVIKRSSGRTSMLMADCAGVASDLYLTEIVNEFECRLRSVITTDRKIGMGETATYHDVLKPDTEIYVGLSGSELSDSRKDSAFRLNRDTDSDKAMNAKLGPEDAVVYYKDNAPFVFGMGTGLMAKLCGDAEPVTGVTPTKRYDAKRLTFDINGI